MKKLILAAVLLLPLTSAWGHSKQEAIINDVDARLQRLQLLMDSQNLQEMYLRLEKLDQENRQLLGKVEELEHQLNQAKDRERKLYLDMDQRLGQLESGGGSYSTGGITPLPPNDSATPDYTTSESEQVMTALVPKKRSIVPRLTCLKTNVIPSLSPRLKRF